MAFERATRAEKNGKYSTRKGMCGAPKAPFLIFDRFGGLGLADRCFRTGLQIWGFSAPPPRPASLREQFLAHLGLNWGPALWPGSV